MVKLVRLDTTNLMSATRVLMAHSRQAPGEYLARAVAFVVKDAKDFTPFVEMDTIDTELSAVTTPVLSTRGKRKGLPLRSGRKDVAIMEGGLATMIVLARLHPYSDYNILTDRKYALDRATFSPGQGMAGFWKKVEEVAQRMVKGRHSSTHFFQQSWNAVLSALIPFVPASYRAAVSAWSGRGGSVDPGLGMAQLTGGNTGRAVCVIENRLGMDPKYPTISEIRNEAAHRILEPVLQRSINSNYFEAMKRMASRGLIEQGMKLGQFGVYVT